MCARLECPGVSCPAPTVHQGPEARGSSRSWTEEAPLPTADGGDGPPPAQCEAAVTGAWPYTGVRWRGLLTPRASPPQTELLGTLEVLSKLGQPNVVPQRAQQAACSPGSWKARTPVRLRQSVFPSMGPGARWEKTSH